MNKKKEQLFRKLMLMYPKAEHELYNLLEQEEKKQSLKQAKKKKKK